MEKKQNGNRANTINKGDLLSIAYQSPHNNILYFQTNNHIFSYNTQERGKKRMKKGKERTPSVKENRKWINWRDSEDILYY